MAQGFHLAQVNVAYALGGPGDPVMAEFNARLDEINQLADVSPGFVWRYVTDSRDIGQRAKACEVEADGKPVAGLNRAGTGQFHAAALAYGFAHQVEKPLAQRLGLLEKIEQADDGQGVHGLTVRQGCAGSRSQGMDVGPPSRAP